MWVVPIIYRLPSIRLRLKPTTAPTLHLTACSTTGNVIFRSDKGPLTRYFAHLSAIVHQTKRERKKGNRVQDLPGYLREHPFILLLWQGRNSFLEFKFHPETYIKNRDRKHLAIFKA